MHSALVQAHEAQVLVGVGLDDEQVHAHHARNVRSDERATEEEASACRPTPRRPGGVMTALLFESDPCGRPLPARSGPSFAKPLGAAAANPILWTYSKAGVGHPSAGRDMLSQGEGISDDLGDACGGVLTDRFPAVRGTASVVLQVRGSLGVTVRAR